MRPLNYLELEMRGGPGPGGHMPPHMMHQFQHQHHSNNQQSGWRFSWINIVPIYTLCIVGYAIYIYFKGASTFIQSIVHSQVWIFALKSFN